MEFNRHVAEEPEINLTPLIDVVLVLLIFFMVTTTFIRGAGLHVDLPEAASDAPVDRTASLEVAVDADGGYYINGRKLRDSRVQTLQRGLEEVAGEDRERPLLIRADGATSHQSVVTVMDVAGQMGFRQLSISIARPEQ